MQTLHRPVTDKVIDEPTTATYVSVITRRTRCKKHHADLDEPCWFIYPDGKVSKGLLEAVCGHRARNAGFVGNSNQDSLRVKSVRRYKK